MNWNSHSADLLSSIRSDKPLIHHITNVVVTNDTANVTLHLGALPVMAHAVEEVAESHTDGFLATGGQQIVPGRFIFGPDRS